MQNFRQELADRFRDYTSEELIEKLKSGTLIELAQDVAKEELKARGLESNIEADSAMEEPLAAARNLFTVEKYFMPTDAYIVQGCLVAAGVPAVVADANHVQANSLLSPALGGARILVPHSYLQQAHEIIDAFNRGEYELEQQNDTPSAPEKSTLGTDEALLAFTQDPIWIEVWQGLINKTSRLAGFNPFAAVMGITWFFFRKMYLLGMAVMLADALVLTLFDNIGLLVLVRILIGMLANIGYYKKTESAVREVQAEQLLKEQAIQRLKRQGGISIGGMLISVVIMFTIRSLLRM